MAKASRCPGYGLSPLARGNLHAQCMGAVCEGPIPARAGQPSGVMSHGCSGGAYPRSRGATERGIDAVTPFLGLSPLARGNRTLAHAGRARRGPIPARAGQPWSVRGLRWKPWAYPRSRGATWCSTLARTLQTGLSPLARGNQHPPPHHAARQGPIPARAGQPLGNGEAHGICTAYPRSRGATTAMRRCTAMRGGLSPLARGNPPDC